MASRNGETQGLLARWGRVVGGGIIGAALVGVLLVSRDGLRLDGQAEVIDGDSLRIAGREIRLYGIDAPEYGQICKGAAGEDIACGRRARQALSALVAGRVVACVTYEVDRFGRDVAACKVEGRDIAAALVEAGEAIATDAYGAEQARARAARRGLWAGSFDAPALWRARHPRGAP